MRRYVEAGLLAGNGLLRVFAEVKLIVDLIPRRHREHAVLDQHDSECTEM